MVYLVDPFSGSVSILGGADGVTYQSVEFAQSAAGSVYLVGAEGQVHKLGTTSDQLELVGGDPQISRNDMLAASPGGSILAIVGDGDISLISTDGRRRLTRSWCGI